MRICTGRRERPVMKRSSRERSALDMPPTTDQNMSIRGWVSVSSPSYDVEALRQSTATSGRPHTLYSRSCHVRKSRAVSGTTATSPWRTASICARPVPRRCSCSRCAYSSRLDQVRGMWAPPGTSSVWVPRSSSTTKKVSSKQKLKSSGPMARMSRKHFSFAASTAARSASPTAAPTSRFQNKGGRRRGRRSHVCTQRPNRDPRKRYIDSSGPDAAAGLTV
mmetsp:Transcript_153947/g.269352  ORF Transcript_153947/g.269352 Transcript_153947/m.269352 type:complete len:221 (-) Transcript_153947:108-770(-)